MEADTTYQYQTSEAETEVGNSDDSNYAEMTDQAIPECQMIVKKSNICNSNDDDK